MKSNQVIKIVSIICFALTALILIVLRNSPATGHESSIYIHTPPIVWGVLVLSLVCGLGIVFHQLYTRKEEESNLWIIGLLLIGLSLTILLSLTALRVYAFYGRGDALTHLGTVRNLISSGHFESRNFYPILHIYIAQLSQIGNITPMKLFGYMPAVFAALFIPFMYLFARSVLPKKGQVILATIAGTFILTSGTGGQVFVSPNSQANMLVPLVFFLCVVSLAKDTLRLKIQFSLLLIIMIFLFPSFHPVPAFALLLMMLTLWLPIKIYNIWGKKFAQPISSSYGFIAPVVLLLFVWGITWISSFYIWASLARNIYTALSGGGPSQLDALRGMIDFATSYGYSVWEQFFIRFAGALVFIILTLISVPILLKKMPSNKNLRKLLSLYGLTAACALAMIMFFGLNLPFGAGRMLVYILIIGAIFAGFVFYEVLERTRNTPGKGYLLRLCLSVMVLILVLLSVNGVFSSHYGRYTKTPSSQVTSTEMKGMKWFFNNKDIRIASLYNTTAPRRYADILLTPEEKQGRPDILKGKSPLIPWHFNYDTQSMLGESYTKDIYMVVTKVDRAQYVEVYPEIAEFRFYPSDFDRLEDDPSIDKLYSNGGLDVWYVRPLIRSP